MWQLSSLFAEVSRNLWSDRSRTILIVGALVTLAGAISGVEAQTAAHVVERSRQLLSHGYNVVAASSDAGLPADACVTISDATGVRTGGGFTSSRAVHLDTSPGTEFMSAGLVGDALLVLTGAEPSVLSSGEVALGSALADELAIGLGSLIRFNGQEAIVARILPINNRTDRYSRWLLYATTSTDEIEECMVEFHPGVSDGGVNLLAAAFSEASGVSVRPLIGIGTLDKTPEQEWTSRASRYGWVTLLPIAFGLLLLNAWSRRVQWATYRILGVSRSGVMAMIQLETAVLVTIAVILGGVIGTLPVIRVSIESARMGIAAAANLLFIIALSPWLGWLATSRDIAAALKDR